MALAPRSAYAAASAAGHANAARAGVGPGRVPHSRRRGLPSSRPIADRRSSTRPGWYGRLGHVSGSPSHPGCVSNSAAQRRTPTCPTVCPAKTPKGTGRTAVVTPASGVALPVYRSKSRRTAAPGGIMSCSGRSFTGQPEPKLTSAAVRPSRVVIPVAHVGLGHTELIGRSGWKRRSCSARTNVSD